MIHSFSQLIRPKYIVIFSLGIFFLVGCSLLIFLSRVTQDASQSQDPLAKANQFQYLDSSRFVSYGVNLRTLYEQEAGFGSLPVGNLSAPDTFGAYFLLPVDNVLYLGLGQYPAQADGALVAALDATNLSLQRIPINNTLDGKIEEQGIHLMVYDKTNKTIVFPGTDPTSSWALGNIYVIDTTSKLGSQYRDTAGLSEVVHGWGLTIDSRGKYYYGTGSFLNQVPFSNSPITAGEVFQSVDKGLSWKRKTIDPAQATSANSFLSAFRVYSLAWLEDKLFAANSESNVWWSVNEGETWTKILDLTVDPVLTTIELNKGEVPQKFILTSNLDGRILYKIGADGSVENFQLPFKIISSGYYHGKMTTDGEWVYVISDNQSTKQNSIYRSKNLSEWYLVDTLPTYDEATGGKAISMAYWPYRDELVVSTDGANATIYSINISNIPSVSTTPIPTFSPYPTPITTECLSCNDPRYDHSGDGQITQEDIQWFISNCLGRPNSLSCPDLNNAGTIFLSGDILCAVSCLNQTPAPLPVISPTILPSITPTPSKSPTPTQPPLPTPSNAPIFPSDFSCSQISMNPSSLNLTAGPDRSITLSPGLLIGRVNYLPAPGEAYWSRIVKENSVICSSYYISTSKPSNENNLKLTVSRRNSLGCTLQKGNSYAVQTLIIKNGITHRCPVGKININ